MALELEPVVCGCGAQRSASDRELVVSGYFGQGSRPALDSEEGHKPCELRVCAGCWCVYAVPIARVKVANVGSG